MLTDGAWSSINVVFINYHTDNQIQGSSAYEPNWAAIRIGIVHESHSTQLLYLVGCQVAFRPLVKAKQMKMPPVNDHDGGTPHVQNRTVQQSVPTPFARLIADKKTVSAMFI
jgi:hypothetical protein